MRALSILAASALALGMAAAVNSADAACKRFGFTVNDYGKEGPTNDAKALLDKHVTQWAAENGISDYRVSKKDVKCELFLDFVVFDEYTCTASANVCWGADQSKIAPSEDVAVDSEKPPAPVSKVTAGLKREKPAAAQTAASDAADAPAQAEQAQAPAAEEEAAPLVEQAEQAPPATSTEPPAATAAITPPAAEADNKPHVEVSTGAPVETGALGDAMSDKPLTPPGDAGSMGDGDQADAASSAAAAAAAAAERAAAAAETAAAAAKEAAAAAVAASAANRGVIVPPIDAR